MAMINFMVIGAVKAGTTSVYYYLREHPQVYMSPIKETKFFQWDGEERRFSGPLDQKIYEMSVKTFEEYQSLFKQVSDEKAIGEATPSYLYNKEVPMRIYRRFPKVKMIVILRHPAERAFSHYLHTKWLGYEPLSFSEALAQEDERIQLNWGPSWHYKQQGFYYEQIKRYMNLFGDQQVRIYLFEDLIGDTFGTISDIYAYLGVDPNFKPEVNRKYNVRFFPKNQFIHDLTNQYNRPKAILKSILPKKARENLLQFVTAKNRWKPQFDQELHGQLTECYIEDILKLQDLTKKDLSKWLHGSKKYLHSC
ncbi:MAG: sulfotransferase [Symploca sp. SIO2B6]|nr:sulfotransferase [Symploca sp. SIO2B6]